MPLVRKAIGLARPYAMAVGLSALAANREVGIVVAHGGDGTRAGEIAALLDARVGAPGDDDLLVAVLRDGEDVSQITREIGDHRRGGGEALMALVGAPPQRRRMERELLEHPDIAMSAVTHIDAWDSVGIRAFKKEVVRVLGLGRIAAGQRYPAIRDAAAHRLATGAANRAAVVAVLPLNTGTTTAVLSVIQARTAADISGLRASAPDPREGAIVAGAAISAPVWRAVARRLIRAMPPLESLIRGGMAYTVTRGVATVAQRAHLAGHSATREES